MNRNQRHSIASNLQGQVACYSGLKLGDSIQFHWWTKIAMFCLLLGYSSQLVGLFQFWDRGDMETFFEALVFQAFYGMSILKLVSLRRNYNRWYYLLTTTLNIEEEQLKDDKKDEFDEGTAFTFSESIKAYTVKCVKISRVISRLYITTNIMHMTGPYIENGLRKLAGYKTMYRPHIVPCWAPLDNFGMGGYIVSILLEYVTDFYAVCIHVGFDVFSVGIMIFICGQFSLLRDYSENIGFKNQMRISKTNDDLAHEKIKKCHQMHVTVKNLVKELRSLLKTILGIYFINATVLLCSVAVRIDAEISGIQLASMVQYMCATSVQLFLFCYYGDKMLTASYVGMGEGPFGAAYWSLSPRVRRELVILGTSMSQPCGLYAGPFISVDLPSFIQVIRTAYSYYAFICK